MYTPYIGDGVHGVTQPDIGLSSHVPDGRIPRNYIDNFGQQVDDCLVVFMLEVAIRLLKPLLNEFEKVSDLSRFSDNPEICLPSSPRRQHKRGWHPRVLGLF